MPGADNSPKIITSSFCIGGMTCPACQHRIENKLKDTPGIHFISADYNTGAAKVQYDASLTDFEKITAAIENLGYEVTNQKQSPNVKTAVRIVGVLVIILAASALLQAFGTSGVAAAFPIAQTGMSNIMVLLIGLLTSAHCIAMCGGINLSQTINGNREEAHTEAQRHGGHKEKEEELRFRLLSPSLLYNAGRLISYTVVGIVVGAIGSAITISGHFRGAVLLIAGIFMVIMGINMLGIFPALRRITPHLPQFLTSKVQGSSIGKGPLIVGFLNGFMPCGPLQAMQLYALSTGSPLRGGIAMFLFCLGTIPLMFALGAAGSLLSGARGQALSRRVMQTGAVIIAAMGLVMFANGWNSSNLPAPAFAKAGGKAADSSPVIKNGKQIINSTLQPGRYPAITVQQGIPVRWTINAPAGSINGCNNRFIISEYNITHTFKTGDNVIEFMPENSGRFRYSCWMSMIHGTITVLAPGEVYTEPDTTPKPSGIKIPTDSVAVAADHETGNYQTVTINLDNAGFSPAIVVMQRGTPTLWTINNDSLDPGNYSLVVPIYYAKMEMQRGENPLQLIPDDDFEFSTGNNKSFGFVKVVNDINTIDIEAIKAEVKNLETFIYPDAYFEATAYDGGGCPCCSGAAL